jgi:hypothetical protein
LIKINYELTGIIIELIGSIIIPLIIILVGYFNRDNIKKKIKLLFSNFDLVNMKSEYVKKFNEFSNDRIEIINYEIKMIKIQQSITNLEILIISIKEDNDISIENKEKIILDINNNIEDKKNELSNINESFGEYIKKLKKESEEK